MLQRALATLPAKPQKSQQSPRKTHPTLIRAYLSYHEMKSFASFLVLIFVCALAEGLVVNQQQPGQYDAYVSTYYRWPQTNFVHTASRNQARSVGSRSFNDKRNAVAFATNLQHVGGIPYLSEFSEEKQQAFSSQIPGYYPQQLVSFYTSYQPVIERDSLNPLLDTNTENNLESTTQLNDDLYETTEKNAATYEVYETTYPIEKIETTTDFSETFTSEENFPENSNTNTEINELETSVETSTSSTSESNNINPSTPELLKLCWAVRGQYPSPYSCKNFINCWDDTAMEQECSPGTLFNDKIGFCDHPANVDCGIRPIYASDEGLSSDCSVDYTRFRSNQNCSEYFVCINHKPILHTCGPDLYYDLKLGICNYKYNVPCEIRHRPKRDVPASVEEPKNAP